MNTIDEKRERGIDPLDVATVAYVKFDKMTGSIIQAGIMGRSDALLLAERDGDHLITEHVLPDAEREQTKVVDRQLVRKD